MDGFRYAMSTYIFCYSGNMSFFAWWPLLEMLAGLSEADGPSCPAYGAVEALSRPSSSGEDEQGKVELVGCVSVYVAMCYGPVA